MSVIHRFSGSLSESTFSWEGVPPVEINADEVQGVVKHVLVGQKEGASDFIIRYFQVPAGSRIYPILGVIPSRWLHSTDLWPWEVRETLPYSMGLAGQPGRGESAVR